MNKAHQASQLRLAASIIETGHSWEYRVTSDRWVNNMENDSPLTALAFGREIRLALATPPDGRPLHNPDNLTAEQVGAGWRLLLASEMQGGLPSSHPGHHKCEGWKAGKWYDEHSNGSVISTTYRLPLSVPWQEAPKPEPAFKLPPPPPGKQWHREDWTEDMLPQGYRPLLLGEFQQIGDEWFTGAEWDSWTSSKAAASADCGMDGSWLIVDVFSVEEESESKRHCCPRRTRRPLPVEPVYTDLGPDDVPPLSLIRRKPEQDNGQQWHWRCVSYVTGIGPHCGDRGYTWQELRENHQINRPRHRDGDGNPTLWEPCRKEVKPL